MKKLIICLAAIFILTNAVSALAKGRLVVYCSNEAFACQAVVDEFAKKYDVKVQMTRSGSGSTYAKILAEKDNPKGDVWYAGTLDPHSQAGVNGLLEPYKSPMLKEIGEEFRNPATSKMHHSAGVYAGVLGYSVNTDVLAEKNLRMHSVSRRTLGWAAAACRPGARHRPRPRPAADGRAVRLAGRPHP